MRRCSRIHSVVLLLVAALAAASAPASADVDSTSARLVNIESPSVTSRGLVDVGAEARFFGSPESVTYPGAEIRYGLMDRLELGLRGEIGGFQSLNTPGGATILHGGRDVEAFVKYHLGEFGPLNAAALAGVSFPATPAQDQATGTFSAVGAARINDRVTGYLNPRAVFLSSNSIVGIGVGAQIKVTDQVRIVGDWTGVVAGNNTRSIYDGSLKRANTWGAAVRWSPETESRRIELDLGWGNALGSTTALSLTPALGYTSGFFIALRVHP